MTHDAIRHVLAQAHAAGMELIGQGTVTGAELEALRSFVESVQDLVTRLERARTPIGTPKAIDNLMLVTRLFELHKLCSGGLERFRGFIEDAISACETIAP